MFNKIQTNLIIFDTNIPNISYSQIRKFSYVTQHFCYRNAFQLFKYFCSRKIEKLANLNHEFIKKN
ncbi:hypothetical protein BLOT_008933 [Blomia tropicalis]|nr:hypothetical protein BLOT_008933 [Blomia tropicalis]